MAPQRIFDLTKDPGYPRPVNKSWKQRNKVDKIVLHCSDKDWTIDELYEYDVLGEVNGEKNHIDPNGCPSFTYHEVFMSDGVQYHCNSWHDWIWHAAGHNKNSLGACLMYRATPPYYTMPNREPPEAAVDAFILWAAKVCLYLRLSPYEAVRGHRELKGTGWFLDTKGHKRLRKTCPGLATNLGIIRNRVAIRAQKYLYLKAKVYGAEKAIDWGSIGSFADGVWGPMTKTVARLLHNKKEILLDPKHGGLII